MIHFYFLSIYNIIYLKVFYKRITRNICSYTYSNTFQNKLPIMYVIFEYFECLLIEFRQDCMSDAFHPFSVQETNNNLTSF